MAEPQHEETAPMDLEVEGLDDSGRDYPLNDVLIRNEGRSIYEVLRRIDAEQYIMDPDFQRDFIWDERKQSKLIESVIMRIPLPVFYLAEDGDGKMIVVDGLQRLSTFKRFVGGDLALRLEPQSQLNEKKFDDLPTALKNRIEDCNLILYLIDSKVPERARLDIFERVNGGVPLTRQQMRNSLYNGAGTRFLKREAETAVFLNATGGSLNKNTMRDREFVNRFCAFHLLGEEAYRGDMDEFLAQAIIRMNGTDERSLGEIGALFRNGLENNHRVFGRYSFRKRWRGQEGGRRSVINASLWDVMVTGLSRIDGGVVESRGNDLKEGFYRLMENDEFIAAITYGTNTTSRVSDRFRIANKMFAEVFDSHA